jgi:Tfp pilus assembly PilM family ATPase
MCEESASLPPEKMQPTRKQSLRTKQMQTQMQMQMPLPHQTNQTKLENKSLRDKGKKKATFHNNL